MDEQKHIHISGARVNNLKDVSCVLPHEKLTVITGPSGSGKSSLAFDTLFAEGQRRYIESLSSYARQFLARIEKPDVDRIDHILPAIALEQKNSIRNARSTVGTATDIYDFLKLLFAHIGQTRCDACGGEVSKISPDQIRQYIGAFEEGAKILLVATVPLKNTSVDTLLGQGFLRIWRQHEMQNLGDVRDDLNAHEVLDVIVDRLVVRTDSLGKISPRLMESTRSALMLGDGTLSIVNLDDHHRQDFRTDFSCLSCGKGFEEPFPNMFSFNSPLGACPTCEGFGRIIGLDLDKVIPNKSLSLAEGAIHPYNTPANRQILDDLLKEAKKRKIPVDAPYSELSDQQKRFVLEGGGGYEGVRPFFDWLETKKYKVHVRVMLAKYRGYYPCPECLGARVRKDALNVTISEQNILDVSGMSVRDLRTFFETLELSELQQAVARPLLREITARLDYLDNIGLSYLTLARQSRTLSGGEAQRINLSAALGSRLTDTLYVLDEPTVGLHARDTDRLIGVLKSLRDHGNTIVVVEHDPDVILQADHVVDMGPGGGEEGGRIVYEGDAADLLQTAYSQTGRYLSNPGLIRQNSPPGMPDAPPAESDWVTIAGASGHNLKNIDVRLPVNRLVCVTGVSGSGKSSLIKGTLFAAYEHRQGRSLELDELPHRSIDGLDRFADVILVDQTPPGRSIRSNPATYVKVYDDIRQQFAESRKAMVLGITASDFSFNSAGGRCETCQGLGTLTIDMQFMADVTVTCHDCQGRRFNPNVLSIEVEGRDPEDGKKIIKKNIFDVLQMTIDEALVFFRHVPRIRKKLTPLKEIGLGYLRLGQSTATLSGGEAQRLKLAGYLKDGTAKSNYLFLFDEPTTGLHMADIERLVQAFRRIIEAGHSVIVIEHNIDFIAQADYITDLGPEGGDGGGAVVAAGSVEDIIKATGSHTGHYLARRFKETGKAIPAVVAGAAGKEG